MEDIEFIAEMFVLFKNEKISFEDLANRFIAFGRENKKADSPEFQPLQSCDCRTCGKRFGIYFIEGQWMCALCHHTKYAK